MRRNDLAHLIYRTQDSMLYDCGLDADSYWNINRSIGRRLYKRYNCTRNIIPQEYESMGLLATREGPTRGLDMAVQPEEPPFVGDVV